MEMKDYLQYLRITEIQECLEIHHATSRPGNKAT
jgi:hypothetical protein